MRSSSVMEVGETSQAGAVGPHRHDIFGILGLEVVRVFGYRDPAAIGPQSALIV